MSRILLATRGPDDQVLLLAPTEGEASWSGHSWRSSLRATALRAAMAGPGARVALIGDRVRAVVARVLAEGVPLSEDGDIPGRGIGHWTRQGGQIYRVTGSGAVYPAPDDATDAETWTRLRCAAMLACARTYLRGDHYA